MNQLNDAITELKIKQYNVINENKILKRNNERLRESSKVCNTCHNMELNVIHFGCLVCTLCMLTCIVMYVANNLLQKDLENQNKLETESEKLKLEIEQLKESSEVCL